MFKANISAVVHHIRHGFSFQINYSKLNNLLQIKQALSLKLVVTKDFDTDVDTVIQQLMVLIFSMFKVSNIILLSLKVIALFYLMYKTEPGSLHIPTSKMELFATKAIAAKDSILDAGRGPGLTS